jgi:hypothetical protein
MENGALCTIVYWMRGDREQWQPTRGTDVHFISLLSDKSKTYILHMRHRYHIQLHFLFEGNDAVVTKFYTLAPLFVHGSAQIRGAPIHVLQRTSVLTINIPTHDMGVPFKFRSYNLIC